MIKMKWNLHNNEDNKPVQDCLICKNKKYALMLRYEYESMTLYIIKINTTKNGANNYKLLKGFNVSLKSMFPLILNDIVWSFRDYGDKWLFSGLYTNDTPREVSRYVRDCFDRFFCQHTFKNQKIRWSFTDISYETESLIKYSITDNEILIINSMLEEAVGKFILKYMYKIMKEIEEKRELVGIISPNVEIGKTHISAEDGGIKVRKMRFSK